MADVKIILPDGSAKEYAAGTTLGEQTFVKNL